VTENDRYLTRQDACAYLGVSKDTLDRLTRRDHLPIVRVGKRVVISKRVLDEWIERHTERR
jgi:excisionase family DNA binding protein